MKKPLLIILVFIVCLGVFLAFLGMHAENQAFQDKTFLTKVGNTFFIKIDSNPSTGFTWDLNNPLDTILLLQGSDYVPRTTNPKVIGGGGDEIWTFQAIKPGKTVISLKYQRTWEKNIPPAKVYDFPVEVKD